MWVCVGQIVIGTGLYVVVWWTDCYRDNFPTQVLAFSSHFHFKPAHTHNWLNKTNLHSQLTHKNQPTLSIHSPNQPTLSIHSPKPTHTHNWLTKISPPSQFTHQNQPTLKIHSPKPAHFHNSLTKTSPHSQSTHQNQPTLTFHSPKPAHTHNSLTYHRRCTIEQHRKVKCVFFPALYVLQLLSSILKQSQYSCLYGWL